LTHYLDLANVGYLVSAATTADDVARSKPHPDVFKSILEKLGDVDPSCAIAIGDSPYDAEAAGKAGVRTIGFLCGGFPAGVLKDAGCIELYDNPLHLLQAFEHSPLSTQALEGGT
jgi:beta-phosphoglucomutase-like phosphatase (HAD superfamily)